MSPNASQTPSDERRAVLGLWSIPGIGAKSVEVIRRGVDSLPSVLEQPPSKWAAGLRLPPSAREALAQEVVIAALADRMLEAARRARVGIAFRGDPAYPARLAEVADAPPLLFYRGPACSQRRRVAMVGTRSSGRAFDDFAIKFASEVAVGGVGIVSGAAVGVDTACMLGALAGHGETWAFVGCGLDRLDEPQAWLQRRVLERGGTFYSDYPLGVPSDPQHFPRRNRLISGAADVTLVLRAPGKSGALHTARYALKQGRRLLAMPGEARNDMALGCNDLIRGGKARLCLTASDVFKALELENTATVGAPQGEPVRWEEVSEEAKAAFALLRREPIVFEDLLAEAGLPSGVLAGALCELELLGLVVQRPGKRYEKV